MKESLSQKSLFTFLSIMVDRRASFCTQSVSKGITELLDLLQVQHSKFEHTFVRWILHYI